MPCSPLSLLAAGPQVVSLLQSLGKREGDVALGQLALRIRAATQMASGADPFAKVKVPATRSRANRVFLVFTFFAL